MNAVLACIGIILTVSGYFIKEIEKKRHFDRRNAAGIEGFKSYIDLKIQYFIDTLIRHCGIFLMIIGILFLFYGFVFTITANT